jgi:hypothetical protein
MTMLRTRQSPNASATTAIAPAAAFAAVSATSLARRCGRLRGARLRQAVGSVAHLGSMIARASTAFIRVVSDAFREACRSAGAAAARGAARTAALPARGPSRGRRSGL